MLDGAPSPAPLLPPRLGAAVFAALFGLFLLTGSRGEVGSDSSTLMAVAENLVLQGRPEVDTLVPGYSVRGPDGALYAKYGLGQPLLMTPAVFWKRVLVFSGLPAAEQTLLSTLGLLALPAAAGALSGLLLLLMARLAGASLAAASLAVVALALTTPLWVYARILWSEALQTALVAVGLALPLMQRHRPEARWPLLAGLALGLAVLTKSFLVLAVPAAAALLALGRREHAVRDLALLGAGLAPFAALAAWYNALRFGTPLSAGYADGVDVLGFSTPLPEGLYGLVLSPGKGLLLYAPALLLLPWGLRPLWRRARGPVLVVAALIAAWTGAVACWWAWHGGETWGPRLMVPLLPVMMVPVALALDRVLARGRLAHALTALALLAGFAVQLPGVLVSFADFYRTVPYRPYAEVIGLDRPVTAAELDRDNLAHVHFDLPYSPIAGHWWLALQLPAPTLADPPWAGSDAVPDRPPRLRPDALRADLWLARDLPVAGPLAWGLAALLLLVVAAAAVRWARLVRTPGSPARSPTPAGPRPPR